MSKSNRKSNAVLKTEVEMPTTVDTTIVDLPKVDEPDVSGLVPETEKIEVVEPQVEETSKGTEPTAAEHIAFYGNKSKAIRALNAQGFTRAEIAKKLGLIYQHVNNVLHQPLKREIKAQREAAAAAAAAPTQVEPESAAATAAEVQA